MTNDSQNITDMKAFPVSWNDEQDFHGGMNIRHYFAAKAMQSLISNKSEYLTDFDYDRVAWVAYRFADSMMELL